MTFLLTENGVSDQEMHSLLTSIGAIGYSDLIFSVKTHGYIPTLNFIEGGVDHNNCVQRILQGLNERSIRYYHQGLHYNVPQKGPQSRPNDVEVMARQSRGVAPAKAKEPAQIKPQTIAKDLRKIHDASTAEYAALEASEEAYGYVTEKAQKEADKFEKEYRTRRDMLIQRISELRHFEVANPDEGLTSDEAEALLGFFGNLERYLKQQGLDCTYLHYIGNGEWC